MISAQQDAGNNLQQDAGHKINDDGKLMFLKFAKDYKISIKYILHFK